MPSPRGSPLSTMIPRPMEGIEAPDDHDVLCGRGVTTNNWAGNERFRSLVNCNKELYVTSTKRQKMTISRSIVDAVRSLDPPGRFLEKKADTGLWSDIGEKKAIEKTSQALRDGAAALRKQLSQDLGDPDFLNAVFDVDSPLGKAKAAALKAKNASRKTKGKAADKKKTPAKGHRRTKSNPSVGTATKMKAMTKKARAGVEKLPVSPKRSFTINLAAIPRPPQSPISPGSDRVAEGRGHSRNRSAESAPIIGLEPEDTPYSPRSPRYAVYDCPQPRLQGRSASFDYHQLDRGHQEHLPHPGAPPSPRAYGNSPSPRQHHLPPPHPMSPRSYHRSPSGPRSPLPPGRHHRSPAGYRQAPPSPAAYHRGPPSPTVAWSPRQFNHGSVPSLSPHPYLHPSDPQCYRSPEYRHDQSPRMQCSPRSGGNMSPGLSVPTLGGEQNMHGQHRPMWRPQRPQFSPRTSSRRSYPPPPPPAQHRDFTPPHTPPLHRKRTERDSPDRSYSERLTFNGNRIMSPARYPDPDAMESSSHDHDHHRPREDHHRPREDHERHERGHPDTMESSPDPRHRQHNRRPVPLESSHDHRQQQQQHDRHRHEQHDHRPDTMESSHHQQYDHRPDTMESSHDRRQQQHDYRQSRDQYQYPQQRGERPHQPQETKSSGSPPRSSSPVQPVPSTAASRGKAVESMDSPSAVADVTSGVETQVDDRMRSPIHRKTSRDGSDYPFDEDNPAADDDLSMSPLPFDREDPSSLLELPDNILQLPISPCGPTDGGR